MRTTAGMLSLLVALAVSAGGPPAAGGAAERDWVEAEQGILANHVQLTFPDQFLKAGEAYFCPEARRIIFQAVPADAEGDAAEFYVMYVADLVRDEETDLITGIDHIRRISPEGTANTCGWFHPTDPDVVIFSSTLIEPSESTPPGYQRATGRYRWMFPPEMDIVTTRLSQADGTLDSLTVLVTNRSAYIAEASISPNGRHLLYCSLESNEGDLFVRDLRSGRVSRIVEARGYDGGPFFSPDGRRICYRSDRRGDNRLQLFIGELAFNRDGEIVGLEREYQITNNDAVNWAPFWHPGGRHLVYATSEVSHRQYEVFIIDADPGNLDGSDGTIRYGTNQRRVTHSEGFDGLPVFDSAGRYMMWTSQRPPAPGGAGAPGEGGTSQVWAAEFIMPLEREPAGTAQRRE